MKKYYMYIDGIISIIGGTFLLLMAIFNFESLINLTCILIGVLVIIINFVRLFISSTMLKVATEESKNDINGNLKTYAIFNMALAIAGLILGTWFIFYHGLALSIVFALYLVIYPIARIIFASDKKKGFKQEIPYFIMALIIVLLTSLSKLDLALKIVAIIIACLIIISGIISVILSYKKPKEEKIINNQIERETIEVEAEEVK